ncbi:MAG: hypothetical protein MN733_09380 [Nitrososphaera sp.]|nr:hypothetical protein [Nitrososphaera sp.]
MIQFTVGDPYMKPFSEEELAELRQQGRIGFLSGLLVSLPLLAFYVVLAYGLLIHFGG